MCLGAIYWARPAALYFAASREDAAKAGFDDAHIYDEIAAPLAKRRIPSTHVKHDKAISAFNKWSESGNKIPY
jgi:guanine deaminase